MFLLARWLPLVLKKHDFLCSSSISTISLCYISLKQVAAFTKARSFVWEGAEKVVAVHFFFFSKIWEAAQRHTVEGITQEIPSLSPLGESQ